jgi:NADH-quinone oxidoreductase subunit C
VTLEEIHGRLKAKFGDAIGEWAAPEAGDAWIAVLEPGRFHEICEHLKSDPELAFDFLRCISGVDYVEWMESVYHFLSYEHDREAVLKVKLDRADPKVPSVMDLWPAAEWHEREAYDLLGIEYEGHASLKRILLPEDWIGHPLRKDYKQPDEYHGISNW